MKKATINLFISYLNSIRIHCFAPGYPNCGPCGLSTFIEAALLATACAALLLLIALLLPTIGIGNKYFIVGLILLAQ